MTVERSLEQCGRNGRSGGPEIVPLAAGGAVDRLREHGYRVRHGVVDPGGADRTIDHLAVGPAGILVVTAVPLAEDRPDHWDDDASRAQETAVSVGALLPMPAALHTVPVLCATGRQRVAGTLVGATTVVSPDRLVDWAMDLPTRLTPADAVCVANHLDLALRPARAFVPEPRRVEVGGVGADGAFGADGSDGTVGGDEAGRSRSRLQRLVGLLLR
jgi:hypothetical protein